MSYEVRFENGAAMSVGHAVGFAAAVEVARESLLGCMPPGTRPDQVVQPTVVRRIDILCCALCGHSLKEADVVEALLAGGIGVARLCLGCAVAVSTTARRIGRALDDIFGGPP